MTNVRLNCSTMKWKGEAPGMCFPPSPPRGEAGHWSLLENKSVSTSYQHHNDSQELLHTICMHSTLDLQVISHLCPDDACGSAERFYLGIENE